MRGIHLGQRPTTTTGGGASNRITFYVTDDVLYLTDPVTGYTFEAPVTFVGPTTLPSGLITAEADTLFFHYAGGTWQSPASQVEGNAPVGGIIINDTFYVTLANVTYSLPVTASVAIPGVPSGTETSLVVIDGADYLRIVFPDGEVRYEEVHEVPIPDAPGGGSALVTGSDGAQYEKTTYEDGTIRYKPVYEDIEIEPGETPESSTSLVTGTDGADYERTVYFDGTIRFKPTYETLP